MAKADIGMVGLGVMGQMLALNMERNGFRVAGFDLDAEKVAKFASHTDKKVVGCSTIEGFIEVLEKPRRIMMMVPSGRPVDSVIGSIKGMLEPDDQLIDGGNSHFKDTERRAEMLAETGIHYIGTGVSGGEYGALWGPSIMPGGQREAWERVQPVLEAIAAKVGDDPCVAYMGPRGAGHYVKMVHNGIEYALMQSYAEGLEILQAKEDLDLDLHAVTEIWRHGSVIRSWLLDLVAGILKDDQALSDIKGYVPDSGEGRWTVAEAVDLDVPAPIITLSLLMRFVSRQDDGYAAKLLAAMRRAFGGHAVKPAT